MAPAFQHFTVLLAMSFLVIACTGDESSSNAADSGSLMDERDAELECTLGGTYNVVLTMRSGNCGPQSEPSTVTVPESMTFVTYTEMRGQHDIVTAFVFKGCGLRMTQDVVTNTGMLVSTLHAGALQLVSAGLLEGDVDFRRFTDTMPQQVLCEGVYEMTMHLRP